MNEANWARLSAKVSPDDSCSDIDGAPIPGLCLEVELKRGDFILGPAHNTTRTVALNLAEDSTLELFVRSPDDDHVLHLRVNIDQLPAYSCRWEYDPP